MTNTNRPPTCLRVAISCAWVLLVSASAPSNVAGGGESTWAFPGATGRMIYDSTAIGDRLPNFSNVGFQYGNQPIPQVAQAIFVQPGPGDDTTLIQNAINSVSAMPLGPDGFRGAVVLDAGEFQIGGALNIGTSGVVLRGSGNHASGTVLRATGTSQRTLINVRGFSDRIKDSASERTVLDKYVPVGATSFRVDDPSGFSVGDQVIVFRPSTAEWISELGMDMIPPRPDGMPIVQWTPGSKDLLSDRIVTRIEGDRVFINAPITNSLDKLATNELSFTGDLGLTQELSTTESRVIALEFFGTDLSLFQDGEFNILLGNDTGIDWARLELTVGDRLIGDFDFDGVLGVNDIDLLCDALDGTDPAFDLNGDGVVDTADMDQLVLDEIGTLYGDANLDFFVDGQDFVIWNGNKFSSGHGWSEGDFNCDSFVDGQDFVIWNANKFQSAAPSAVPESSGAFIAVALSCLAVWCLRR